MNVHKQIGIPGNLGKGNSEPTLNDILTPLLPRMMIVAGLTTIFSVIAMYHNGGFDFSVLGWVLRVVAGLCLVFVGWFFTRKTSFPPDVDTIVYKIDGRVSFERMADFLDGMKKSIGVGDAILSGGEFVDRLFVRVSAADHREFISLMVDSGVEATRLRANDEILRGNVPVVRVPTFDTQGV